VAPVCHISPKHARSRKIVYILVGDGLAGYLRSPTSLENCLFEKTMATHCPKYCLTAFRAMGVLPILIIILKKYAVR